MSHGAAWEANARYIYVLILYRFNAFQPPCTQLLRCLGLFIPAPPATTREATSELLRTLISRYHLPVFCQSPPQNGVIVDYASAFKSSRGGRDSHLRRRGLFLLPARYTESIFGHL